MYNFGLEITSVFCGTVCPELLAQYHRNIHTPVDKRKKYRSLIESFPILTRKKRMETQKENSEKIQLHEYVDVTLIKDMQYVIA